MTITVHHTPSGGPADPSALVDGPTYDNDPHIVTGFDEAIALISPEFYVDSYMPTSPTRTTTTAAINACIAACLAAGGGEVIFGNGNYFTNDQIICAGTVSIRGQGQFATIIDFLPTSNNLSAFYVSASANTFTFGSISHLTIYSSDTSFVKFGIQLIDARFFEIGFVQVTGAGSGSTLHDTTNSSYGILLKGRDSINIHDVISYADIPIYCTANPNQAGVCLDHTHFSNMSLYSATSILVVYTGGTFTNTTWDGYQEWQGGTTGLSWVDTVSTVNNSTNNRFENIRVEQPLDATAWSFDIEGHAASNVYACATFKNIRTGGRKGWKLRNAFVDLNYIQYVHTGVAYDIDSTVFGFSIVDSFWLDGCSATVSGQALVGATGYGANAVINLQASLTVPANATYQNVLGPLYTGSFGTVRVLGATSGAVTLAVPAVAGSNTLTLPAGTTNFTATGGTSQVVKQTTSGGAFTVGQLAISDISGTAPITNSCPIVSLNNTANYFTGPTVAQGSTGTWFVSGTVTLYDTAGGALFFVKLWDGATVIASGGVTTTAASNIGSVSLSGFITSPAGNLRMDCKDSSATTGKISGNDVGTNSSTITAFRIA